MVAPCRLTCLMRAQISGSRSRSQSEKVLELGGRHAAKLRVFHDGTPHRFAECHMEIEPTTSSPFWLAQLLRAWPLWPSCLSVQSRLLPYPCRRYFLANGNQPRCIAHRLPSPRSP